MSQGAFAAAPHGSAPYPAYRPDVDGLRALAIVPVVAFHAFPALAPGGFVGVDGRDIEDVTDFKLMREFIDRVFTKYLTPRERKILYLYYGLEEGSEAMTLEKIGALMGVTRERIRQMRARAFEKTDHHE